MKKTLTLLLAFLTLFGSTYAQRSKTPPAPAPKPAPKGPPPYVLKKDYEPKMAELNAKVNAASAAANAVRRNMEQEMGKLTRLDSQVSEIHAILNSANFQIAMNADSLKVTRSSIEELTKKTEEQISAMKASQESFAQMVWILVGTLLAVSIAVFVILMGMLNKKTAELSSILHKNEEILKRSLLTSQEKLQKETKDELQAMESRSLYELSSLKRSITTQIEQEKESTAAAIGDLAARVQTLQDSASTQAGPDTDPEVFI